MDYVRTNTTRDSKMIKNPPTNPVFLLLFLLFKIIPLTMAQNTTIFPIDVGVVVDLDTRFGKMGLTCINMALSDFYASHAHYNTRLVLHTRNSTGDVVVAAAAALDLINNVKVQAIIRPESSMQADFVTELGEKAQVPIISFSATSPSLIQRSYFLRIAQNDTCQVKAISAIIQAFGWSEAVVISVNDEFGKGVIPYLTTALQAVGARIPYWAVIPSMATDDQIDAELDRLMKVQTSRVFIVHMLPSLGSRLFARANARGMMEQGFAWIVTNGMTNFFSSSNYSVLDNMQGVLGLKTYVPNTEQLENFRGRWQSKFQQDNPTLHDVKLNVFGLWAYDAAWALATAVETTNFPSRSTNISAGAASLERLEVTQSGPELVRKLSGTRFTGLSGDFSLINGQLQSSTFQVVNVNDNGERGVGYWTPQNGLVRNLKSKNASRYATSTASLGTIIWPGDITSAPKGWQIPMSGIKLKILVPVKNGFKEFVNVTYDNSTNTINVTGYCIDVFKAAIDHESLQYTVPYEFYAYANFSYSQLIDRIFLGNYDAAVGDITIRANRSLYVDFTLPYSESGISMIVPIKDNNGAKNTWVFLKPLTLDLWVTIGCFFVFTGFVVWVLEHRINKDFRGPPRHQIGTSFWFSFSTMAFAHRERVVTNLARFVIIIWCFVVLILTQSYTASFSSILTVRQLQPIITDVNLLMKNGDNVGYKSAFIYEMLKERGFQEEKLRKYSTQEELDELLRNGNGNHGISAAFDETPYMKVFLATYCSKYTMVEPTFSTDGFAFVFRKGSSLTRDVSMAITRLHEGAEMQKIEDKWFKKRASCSNPSTTTTSSNSLTLSLDSFWGLFIVAGVASSVALLISAAMFFHEHRYILTSFDPETSFWCRIRVVLRLYDQRDPNWDDYNGTRLQDSVHGKIGAVEPSPNTNDVHSPPRPSSTESHIVIEELGTPADTELCDLNLNGQATQETEYICN